MELGALRALPAKRVVEVKAPGAWKAFADTMRSQNRPIVMPDDVVTVEYQAAPNCTTCGTFAGCVCVRPMATSTVHCYVCDAQHDPRVPAPRVCESCVRRYL